MFFLSGNMVAQSIVNVIIPEVRFVDSTFEDILNQITDAACIQEAPDQFFLVEFFLSDFRNNYFYVQLWPLVINELVITNIGGYTKMNGKYFLFPKKAPNNIITTISNSSKTIILKTPTPSTGPEYYILIVGVTNDYYQLLWNSCDN